MARFRKGKTNESEHLKSMSAAAPHAGSSKHASSKPRELSSKPIGGGKGPQGSLRKTAKNGSDGVELITEGGNEDPDLINDVSSFLKDIHLNVKKPDAAKGKANSPIKDGSKRQRTREKSERKERPKAELQKKDGEPSAPLPLPLPTPSAKGKKTKFIVEPLSLWYEAVSPLPASPAPLQTPTATQIAELSTRASDLLAKDTEAYQASAASTSSSASDAYFLQTILTRGTLSDRLSALTLLVQSSPMHNTKALETLKGMAERGRGKGGREEGLKAVRCVVDWWVGGGGPSRKLKYFRDQPLLHPSVTDQHLVLWHFEDWLKKYFFSMLQILETFSLDPLDYVRKQTLSFISTLLKEKPEQEQNLLRLLVNKLGDSDKALCSRVAYHLLQLLQAHPAMKGVIVREVKALIFRPAASSAAVATASAQAEAERKNIHIRFGEDEKPASAKPKSAKGKGKDKEKAASHMTERWNTHAWYYAAVTLNQIVLTPTELDRAVARTLISTYFEMFQEILGAGRKDAKAGGDMAQSEELGEVEGKGKKGTDEEKGKEKRKRKEKEVKGEAGFMEVEDASSKMISAILTGVNRALPFAKVDVWSEDAVFKNHIDTLFLITHTSTFNISLQALTLILQICSTLSTAPSASSSSTSSASFAMSLTDRFYRTLYASLVDPRLSETNKEAMYLNLLFKALKADTNTERVKAFVRRFVQVLAAGTGGSGGGPEFAAGGLYLLGELFTTIPALKSLLSMPALKRGAEPQEYDPRKRDPQFANASASPMYELLPLLHHYHPAISLHARQLLLSQPITSSADLSLNTLSHFLDRFVYKNPKKPRAKGASAMQPAATKTDGTGVKLVRGDVTEDGGVLVNEERFRKRRVEDVPVDQLFFHTYFTKKHEKEQQKAAKVLKRKGKTGSDVDSDEDIEEDEVEEREDKSDAEDVGGSEDEAEGHEEDAGVDAEDEGEEASDAEEAEIWKAMKATLPAELEDEDLMDDSDDMPSGLEDEDEDDIPSGLEEEASVFKAEDASDEAAQSARGSDDEDEDALSFAEASDAEDLLPLDADMPSGLIEYDGSDADEDEEWGGIGPSNKRKRGEESGKRKKLRSLPTFASYEDWAKLIEDGPEDLV